MNLIVLVIAFIIGKKNPKPISYLLLTIGFIFLVLSFKTDIFFDQKISTSEDHGLNGGFLFSALISLVSGVYFLYKSNNSKNSDIE
jgi:uncharacterized membrane protein